MSEVPQYSHGHNAAVLAEHRWRSVANCAAFLQPHLNRQTRLLDVGCGPGSITLGFAELCGQVIGVDLSEPTLAQARKDAEERGLPNVEFRVVDAFHLPFEQGYFDVVYCHQVLQHVPDPVALLKEMKRVTKAGGVVSAREADFASFTFQPFLPGLQEWQTMMHKVFKINRGEADAGRLLPRWARLAGFTANSVSVSISAWTYLEEKERHRWADGWATRVLTSNVAAVAKEHAVASQADLERIAQAWRDWASEEDAFAWLTSVEILAKA